MFNNHMWSQLPRDRSPSSTRDSVPRFTINGIGKKSMARTDAENTDELGTDQYSIPSNYNIGQIDTDSENPCIFIGLINYICEMWQLRKRAREQTFSNQPSRSTSHNIPIRRGIRLI